MADAVKPVGRPMKFPYTFSAKIAQFPFKFYIQKNWIWRYYLAACVLTMPVFYKIGKMGEYFVSFIVYSPFSHYHVRLRV